MTTTPVHDVPGLRTAEVLEANLPSMSAAMRKIAQVLLREPAAPLRMSITELAERAGTSPATVTRFCRSLGYEGYPQFRVGVAADLGRAPTRVEFGRAFQPGDEPQDLLRTLVSGHTRSLHDTAAHLDVGACARVARALAQCRQLDLYGTGGSAVVAAEMEHRLYRVGVATHAWADVHTGLASASMLGPSDVAIGISHSGETLETVEMLARARASGALAVAITNSPGSALQRTADIALVGSVPPRFLHPADMSAKHSQLLVLDLLYMLVIRQDYPGAVAKLDVSAAAVAAHRRRDVPVPADQEELA